MLTLHHLRQSRSFRVLWLLEELKLAYSLDYTLMIHERDGKTFLAPQALAGVHPLGKAPILIDTALPTDGQVLAESAFIIEYLIKTYDTAGHFYPQNEQAWRDYTFWLHFAESSLMPPVVMNLILNKTIAKAPLPFRPIAKKIKAKVDETVLNKNIISALAWLEGRLTHHDWLAGDGLTGADIQMHFAIKALERTHLGAGHHHIIAWLERCQERQAYQNVLPHW